MAEQLVIEEKTDMKTGLTGQQVQERQDAGLDNCRVESATKSVSEIVKENVFTYFNLIFLILAVLLAMVRAWRDMTFLVVITANTLIGIIQEVHSKKVLDKLSILNAPKTRTLRDGKITELPSERLVRDDVIVLTAWSQIPADAVVLEGTAQVNEALITGESDEVTKTDGDTLLSGSYVVSGEVTAQLTRVGRESYISKLTLQATKSKDGEQSEMIRSLNYLIIFMGVIIIPIGIALFVQSYFFNKIGLHDSITGMVAAVLGMIPEGLYLLASVAMAVSTVRLANKRVLVHDMKCIETLARVNVLCVDKTGTITEPGMQVHSFCTVAEALAEHEDGDRDTTASDTHKTANTPAPTDSATLRRQLSAFAQNMPKDNATMEAMQAYFTERTTQKAQKVFGFSSETKYSGAVIDGRNYVLGAPEFVLKEKLVTYQDAVARYSGQGYRVLVFAEYAGTLDGKALQSGADPLGFVMLSNPIRKGAKETFSYFAHNDVAIKVISGDNPLTVSVVAQEAGIADADKYVDASTLKTKEDYDRAVEEYTVFGRVTPTQKRALVRAYKAHKKTVAMTGDGVNDVLALKDADCSVAMASGSDAASNVSQLVLLDSDFSCMPNVVMEGRRVVNNIQRSASLYIVKNIFSMLMAVFSVLLVWDYPLEPAQISLVTMFTIGIPSFILALEPNKERIQGHFLVNVIVKALPAGLTDFIAVSGLVWFCREFELNLDSLSTSCTVLIAIVGLMILYRIAKPMTVPHIILMIAMVAGLLVCSFGIGEFFAITIISKRTAMLMVIFALITEPCLRYLSIWVEWIHGKLVKKG
jgi:cation-transporting ATPase E